MVDGYVSHYGPVRVQQLPCDQSIQTMDSSSELLDGGATVFCSLVGLALYAAQDRPDIALTVKELASKMARYRSG